MVLPEYHEDAFMILQEDAVMILEEIQVKSVKDLFIDKILEQIISGDLSIGERLPPEREIAAKMKISRTIVHSGIIELASKGILTVHPRKGTYVNDYRREGTVAILDTLFNYSGKLDEKIFDSLISTRYLLEVENARLAALNRTDDNLEAMAAILKKEDMVSGKDIDEIVSLDFSFHHEIAIATKNVIYPLLIKSMESTYKTLTREFFSGSLVYKTVFAYHKKLYKAIKEGSDKKAKNIMQETLEHGEKILRSIRSSHHE